MQDVYLITLMPTVKWRGYDITKSSLDVVYPWCLARFMTLGQLKADINPTTNTLSNFRRFMKICQQLAQHWPHNTSPAINIWCWTTDVPIKLTQRQQYNHLRLGQRCAAIWACICILLFVQCKMTQFDEQFS